MVFKFFLNDLDKYIKNEIKIKYYLRYVDDLVLFSSNKRNLQKSIKLIKLFLQNEKLEVKNNYQVFLIEKRAIDFLGYRFFRNKTILRKRNMYRISRLARKINKNTITFHQASAIISYYGWIKNSNSYNFYNSIVKPHIKISQAKKIISKNQRKTI